LNPCWVRRQIAWASSVNAAATLWVPNNRPPRSSGMFVLVEGSAESILSADLQMHDLPWFGDRSGQRVERGGLTQSPVGPMPVVATRKSHVVSELVKEVRRMSKT